MKSKNKKKQIIRKQIVDAAKIYSTELAGKSFLFIFGNEYFEVVFKTSCFLHLTGVNTSLSATDFYKKAKSSTLSVNQFNFTNRHPYDMAKKKLPCLLDLPEITRNEIIVVKDFKTLTFTYKLGLTNLHFTIGLEQAINPKNNKILNYYIPKTLRAKDKSIENSNSAEFVDFIFCKKQTDKVYSELLYRNVDMVLPKSLSSIIDEELLSQ